MGPHTTMVTNVEGLPTSDSLLLHGLNGVTSLIGTDASGLASGGYVRIETVPPNLKMYAGPAPDPSLQIAGEGRPSQGSGLVLDGTGAGTILHSMLNLLLKGMVSIILEAPSVRIGGRAAIHPLLWGEIAASLFDSHVHTTAMGPSGIPIAPVMGATALSKTVTTT